MSQLDTIHRKIIPAERHHRIAEAAYFRAERRGFAGGCPLQDWLEAEREIDRQHFQPVHRLRSALVFCKSAD